MAAVSHRSPNRRRSHFMWTPQIGAPGDAPLPGPVCVLPRGRDTGPKRWAEKVISPSQTSFSLILSLHTPHFTKTILGVAVMTYLPNPKMLW